MEKKGGGTRALIGRRNWSKRWFVLHRNVLAYYKDPADNIPAGQVELVGCRLDANSSTRHDHHLTLHTQNGRAFEMRVPSGSDDAAGTYAIFIEAVRRSVVAEE